MEGISVSSRDIECVGTSLSIEIISLITALIGLITLIWGIKTIRNDLKLRSADAVCGFLAQLKAQLIILQQVAYTPGGSRKIWHSVFISFCNDNIIEDINIPEGDKHFSGFINCNNKDNHDWLIFRKCAKKILELFEVSNGQVPLSKTMYENLGDLQMLLIDMLKCKKYKIQMQQHKLKCSDKYNEGPVGSIESVNTEMENLDILINNIIREVDEKTQKLMNCLWKRLK